MQADEEMLLLEAIDNAGFGNWTAVADHVGTKSKDECKVTWAAQYNTWLLIKLTLKGVVFGLFCKVHAVLS